MGFLDKFFSQKRRGVSNQTDREVTSLIDQLDTEDAERQRQALWKLGEMGSHHAVDLILQVIERTTDPKTRLSALSALASIGDPRAANTFLEGLTSEDISTRSWSARGLEKVVEPKAVAPLIELLKDPRNADIAGHIEKALTRQAEGAVEALSGVLDHAEFQVRFRACQALGMMRNSEAVTALINALQHSRRDVRDMAAQYLGGMGDPKAVVPLANVARIDDDVRFRAVESLQKLGRAGIVDAEAALEAVTEAGASEERLRHLIDGLGDRMGSGLVTGSPASAEELVQAGEKAVPLLLEQLRASSYIPWILARIGSPQAVEPLCKLLFETEGFDRDFTDVPIPNRRAVCAAEALGLLDDPGALPALEKLARETMEGGTLNAATDAIARIRKVGIYSSQTEAPNIAAMPVSEQVSLAEDPNLEGETLAELASSNDMSIVVAVAENPTASAETLRSLNQRFSVPGKRLYWQFAKNPNCPGDLLKEIVDRCDNPYTVDLARKHPNFRA